MEWKAETRELLCQLFLNTLSSTAKNRRLAETALSDASENPNFGLVLLAWSPSHLAQSMTRSASPAAVYFKNHLRNRWSPAPPLNADAPPSPTPITHFEKEQIKSLIVQSMLASPPRVQAQLSEALTVIGKHDFPQAWPTLLPELVAGLRQASDYAAVNGILGTANSIFKKFRLFYSLNFQDLPEFFEDHMMEWMTEFKKYLTTVYPSLENDVQGLSALDDLRAANCDNIILYMEKNEEEFQGYLNDFALAVWNLLVKVSSSSPSSPSRDRLTITAIKFLTTVSTSVHHALFAGDGVIPMICESIVIPNVRLRDEDEELFEMNHVEFMRRDMEGSDQDTRRRIACELLKGVSAHYKEQITRAVSLHLQNLLSSFAANPSSFSVSVVLPELQALDVNAVSMLKASALKFLTVFRNQIPKPAVIPVFPDVIRFLGSESIVVHSYAANFIEKLLLVKDEGGESAFEEAEENSCVMKCIMRVLGVADISRDVAGACIQELTSILSKSYGRTLHMPLLLHVLLRAFLQKAPHELIQQGKLTQVLDTFKKLVLTPKTDDQGLQSNRTVKFVKSLVVFMSLFVVKHAPLIAGAIEVKVAAVAAVKLLCESPALLHPNAAQHWGKLLDSVVTLVSRPVEERLDEEPEVPDLGETMGNSSAYIRLHNAGKKEEDPVIGISDSKEFLALKSLLLPVFFVSITLWAISFCQFWKRKYSALLARWQIEYVAHSGPAHNPPGIQDASIPNNAESITNSVTTRKGKEAIQRMEWFKFLMRFRNDAMMIFSIICLQLPFELAYAHLYEVIESGIIRFGLTGAYLLAIQYFTRTGGRISVGLIKHESAENKEYQANSLVYKVFGLYFMQSYIGLLYHALFHRNFNTLREMLLERLIITEEFYKILWKRSLPYHKIHKAKVKFTTKTEKEYLKPTYAASIGEEFEDGLFDGIKVHSSQLSNKSYNPGSKSHQSIECIAVLDRDINMHKLRYSYMPVRQRKGKWNIEPGLAAILVMEHVLLLVKFGISRFVPEELPG
ncbi:unnamed protein product [Rhodiola kirilowii]